MRHKFVEPPRLNHPTRNVVLFLFLMVLCSVSFFAQQNSKNNDYKPDRALKSNARVNPMTLAMELSIPIAGYQGRGGNSLPVSIDYSSKVWSVDFLFNWQTQAGDIKSDNRPMYGKTSSAGWTTSLGVPRIRYPHNLFRGPIGGGNGSEGGQPYNPDDCVTNCQGENYSVYYIKKLEVVMPDGSTHEFRKDDTPHLWGTNQGSGSADMAGTFLSVDGSRMRLEITQSQTTLFMPDGSRYLFAQGTAATVLIDRHGNRMSYDPTNKRWTDTMARVIEDPIPLTPDDIDQTQTTIGDKIVSFPGKDGNNISYTLSWRYLKDPNGGESGLTDTSQELAYLSDQGCQGNLNHWLSTTANPQPHLFKTGTLYFGDHFTRVCHPISFDGPNWWPGPKFNPKVMTAVTLPNGQKYEFKYNIYGEIEKVIYPTGAYERFLYGQVPVVLPSTSIVYDQANRGVIKRWLSEKGDGTDELLWEYQGWDVIAPDGSKTQQFFVTDSPYNSQPYGFGNPYLGRSYEDKVLSTSGQLLRRKLTDFETTGPQTSGHPAAFRDSRPIKEVSIIFEPGSSHALATMTETVYDSNPDPEYFAQLNPKQTKVHNYIVLDLTTAQTANIATISSLFSSSTVATTTELDYLYDANYKARNINGLVTETRVKDAGGIVKAKTQISYDVTEALLTDVSSTRWENPNTIYRGNVTRTRTWHNIDANLYIDTRAQYDQLGNLRNSWDGRNNLTQTSYSATYDYAYPTSMTTPVPDATGVNGSTTAFTTTTAYDYNTGLPISSTDANGQTTQMSYADPVTNVIDPLLRIRKVTAPNGHQTITEYGAGTSASTRWVKSKTQIDETNWKEGYTYFDGLGRTVRSQSVDDDGDVSALTCYDTMGRVSKASNPFRGYSTQSCSTANGSGDIFWTTNTYDAAGRAWKVTSPDDAVVETLYGLSTTGEIGTVVTVKDQASKERRSITNALGQLKRVDEPSGTLGLGAVTAPYQPTAYAYDLLNNLTTVTQVGDTAAECGGASSCSQTRTFTYDALSRLKSAANPESGTINYTYDNNGNLATKVDARSITTTYTYDKLNRVTLRAYTNEPSGSDTPDVSYFYDNLTNAKGKLIKATNGTGADRSTTEYTAFDILG
ncbi:MAG: RHS repeat protein, partial [Acidobacteria bacterium]|nr:RHS repeat protein [Acidobacteriota bacterium]